MDEIFAQNKNRMFANSVYRKNMQSVPSKKQYIKNDIKSSNFINTPCTNLFFIKEMIMKTLAKIQQDKWLGGVCSGFAYALGVPTWIVRLSTTLLFLTTGIGLLAYILLWIFMPVWHIEPQDYLARVGAAQNLKDSASTVSLTKESPAPSADSTK